MCKEYSEIEVMFKIDKIEFVVNPGSNQRNAFGPCV